MIVNELKLIIDYDKKLEYINKKNDEGYKLVSIKGGILYGFEKCEPREYLTISYFDSKENILSARKEAAERGFVIVPHSFDCMRDMLFLTGKRGEVDEFFKSDVDSRLSHYSRLTKRYGVIALVMILIGILLIFEAIAFTLMDKQNILFGMKIFLWAVAAVFVSLTVRVVSVRMSYAKKVKRLRNDNSILKK